MSLENHEQALWAAVLLRAVRDTLPSNPDYFDQAAARRWMLRKNNDFETVCSFAGCDPDWVRHRAHMVKARGWVPRAWEIEGWL